MNADPLVVAAVGADQLTGRAVRACSARYNETCAGAAPAGPDSLLVVFHAARGIETARGARLVTLTRTVTSPRDCVWRVASESFTRFDVGPLTSRRGHAAQVAPVHAGITS